MITNNFNSTHETSNNPIVNAYQSILSERLMHYFKQQNYYNSGFGYFYITKTNLHRMKHMLENSNYNIYHFSGSSKEFIYTNTDNSEIVKVNFINNLNDCVEESYKMSYNSISMSCERELSFISILNELSFVPPNKLKVYNYFYQEGKIVYKEILMDVSPKINPLAYPYIPNLEQHFEDYFNNERSVEIFKGPPGTGKTSLIRALTSKYTPTDTPVFYTNSDHAIESDQLFSEFLSSDAKTIIFEDMDLHLTARNDGNLTMYRLLAASDGFIKSPINSKKIIISTNIPNIREMDSALTRPGRCNAVKEFRALDYNESCAFMESIGKEYSWLDSNGKYTLADLYNHTEI